MKQSLSEKSGRTINPFQSMGNSQHRPILIVIAGPNGSGKTSVTSRLLKHEWMADSVYINPDNIAKDVFDWNSK